jgi:hypothetical protein
MRKLLTTAEDNYWGLWVIMNRIQTKPEDPFWQMELSKPKLSVMLFAQNIHTTIQPQHL